MNKVYRPPAVLFNGHLETIYPALFRRVKPLPWQRERIATPDDDFLDLDWLTRGSDNLVIISHGLEGSSRRAYVCGMARALFAAGFDVLAWNYRGCSGEVNRQLRFYHSGATDDLHTVIRHAHARGYATLRLIGFSLGGNLTLKYLGEPHAPAIPIKQAMAFSVPLDLYGSCQTIMQPHNRIYELRFLQSLKKKITLKARRMPGLDVRPLKKISNLYDFDEHYTAPLHGFASALHYYQSCSALKFVDNIATPVQIINAWNDPFLSPSCYPEKLLNISGAVRMLAPRRGGHVGFAQFGTNGVYWSELQAVAFFTE